MAWRTFFAAAVAAALVVGCLDRKPSVGVDAGQEVGAGGASAVDNRNDGQNDVAQLVQTGGAIGSGGSLDVRGTAAGGAAGVDAPSVDVGVDVPIGGGGASVDSGGAATATGGAFASGGVQSTGGAPATGGTAATGGIASTGGLTGTAGTGLGGSGSGGQTTCGGTTKLCNGACIPTTSCCGGCSGNTPVCSNGVCVGRSIGDTCSTGAECASTVCADGVCCNVACDGQCESCSTASSKGTCAPTTNARTACAGSGTCAGICDGTAANRKSCVYPDDKTPCGTGASCSGAGACRCSSGYSSCPGLSGCYNVNADDYHCGAGCNNCTSTGMTCQSGNCKCPSGQTSCGTACCSSNQYCSGGTCHSKGTNGTSCSDGSQCTSNNCVSNYCCSSASCGSGKDCNSGTCQCTAGSSSACGGCLSWDFESGTQDWGIDTTTIYGVNPGAITAGKVTQSSSQHHSGSRSLSFHVQFDGSVNVDATVGVTVCPTDVLALQVSGFAMAVPDPDYVNSPLPSNIESVYSPLVAPVTQFAIHDVNTWVPFAGTFTTGSASLAFLGVDFKMQGSPWNGTIYLDDVVVAAP